MKALRILIGFLLGMLAGLAIAEFCPPDVAKAVIPYVAPFGDVLVAMLKMVVYPIILFSLVIGAASLPLRQSGKVGALVIGWYLATSVLATVLGVALAYALNPSMANASQAAGVNIEAAAKMTASCRAETFGTLQVARPARPAAKRHALQPHVAAVVEVDDVPPGLKAPLALGGLLRNAVVQPPAPVDDALADDRDVRDALCGNDARGRVALVFVSRVVVPVGRAVDVGVLLKAQRDVVPESKRRDDVRAARDDDFASALGGHVVYPGLQRGSVVAFSLAHAGRGTQGGNCREDEGMLGHIPSYTFQPRSSIAGPVWSKPLIISDSNAGRVSCHDAIMSPFSRSGETCLRQYAAV